MGDLIVSVADEIASPGGATYEILGHLGRGTFGQVLKVRSSDNQVVALKIIRNRHAFRKQAEVEVELLRRLRVRIRGVVCRPAHYPWSARCVPRLIRPLLALPPCLRFRMGRQPKRLVQWTPARSWCRFALAPAVP